MKIAVSGKGGSGKTITAGTLARVLAAKGYDVLAIDDDPDPNLPVSLGVDHETDVPAMPDDLLAEVETPEDERPEWELADAPATIIDTYGVAAPDGVTLLKAGAVEAGEGAFGYSHVTILNLLEELEGELDQVTIADLPAGLGVPSMAKQVDVLLMVVEPSYASLETIRKLNAFAEEYEVPDIRVIANTVRTERDLAFIEEYCADHDLEVTTVIPDDDSIRHAERTGTAPIDVNAESPAVHAIRDLADDLSATHGTGPFP